MPDQSLQSALAETVCQFLNQGMDAKEIMRGLMDAENKLADHIIKEHGAE